MNIYPTIIKEQYDQELQQIDIDESNNLPDIHQLAEWLCHNCKPYFSQTYKPMYRGIMIFDQYNAVSTSPVRKNRKPLNTNPNVHKAVDAAFKQLFGYKFRSGSMFATGGSNNASYYGVNHVVIPIGEFTFCWSPNIHDLYDTSEERYIPHTVPEEMVNFIKAVGYKTTDLNKAISSKQEIMIYCDSYVKIRMDNRQTHQYVQQLFNTVKENLNG